MSDTNRQEDFQRILDNLNTAILLFGPDLRLRYMNPAAEMLFAVSARHLVGKPAGHLIHCPGETPERQLANVFQAGHPITEREMPLLLNEQRQVTVDCTAIPLTHREGEAGLLVELQQVDRQLRISREEALLAQHEAVRDLVRGMAHEIKNPLGGLRGAAQLLELELPEGPLQGIHPNHHQRGGPAANLVDRMLGPNKLPQPQEVNIHVLLERVRNLVLAECGERMHIERDYDPSIPELAPTPIASSRPCSTSCATPPAPSPGRPTAASCCAPG
jgi:two-component system, NtrC family, nitrogen regulation sensor histidine kinase GlnL